MASLGQNELEQIQSRCEMHSIGVSDIHYLFHSTVSHCRNLFVFYLGVTVLQHQLFKCFRGTVYNHIPAGSWSDEVGAYIVYFYIHTYTHIYMYVCFNIFSLHLADEVVIASYWFVLKHIDLYCIISFHLVGDVQRHGQQITRYNTHRLNIMNNSSAPKTFNST